MAIPLKRKDTFPDGDSKTYPAHTVETGGSNAEAGVGYVSDEYRHSGLHSTKRNIKSRHAQMIAIGGAIGTGFFLGSGQALAIGGPAILLSAYTLISLVVYGIITGIMEIATYLPISGASMSYFGGRFLSPSLGFAMGWLYFYAFGIILAYELTAASILIGFWPNNVPTAVWITIMMVVVVGLNFFPVGVYAEAEFWFAGIKVVLIMGMLVLSFILIVGGGPDHQRLGFYYWQNPGAVNEYIASGSEGQFTSFLYVTVFAGFAFYFGPELLVLTTGEMKAPRQNLPTAARRYFYRLAVFYILGTLAIGAICPSNAKGLTTGAGNANASPWVIAIQNAGIPVLPHIVNACILTSAWSAGNSFLFMCSRALYSLAVAGNAPKVFTRCTKQGLPIWAVLAASCFAPLAYLNASNSAGTVFNWLISLTNTAGYTSWILCCIIYIRFRNACILQGIQVPYRSRTQPYASWACMIILTVLLLCNGFTLFYPGRWSVSGFLTTYIGIVLFLVLWLGHKLVVGKNDPWLRSISTIDLKSNIAEVEAEAAIWDATEDVTEKSKHCKSLGMIARIWS